MIFKVPCNPNISRILCFAFRKDQHRDIFPHQQSYQSFGIPTEEEFPSFLLNTFDPCPVSCPDLALGAIPWFSWIPGAGCSSEHLPAALIWCQPQCPRGQRGDRAEFRTPGRHQSPSSCAALILCPLECHSCGGGTKLTLKFKGHSRALFVHLPV